MRRHALGLIAIAFLLGAAFLRVRYGGNDDLVFAMAVCLRVGLLLCALWLALPQLEELLQRVPAWLAASVGLGCLIVAVRPKLILYIAPLLAAIAVLQGIGWLFKPLPRKRRRTPSQGAEPKQPPTECGRVPRRR